MSTTIDASRVDELLGRLHFMNENNAEVCIAAASRFITADLSEANVRKASVTTGLSADHINAAVLHLTTLCTIAAKDPSKDLLATARAPFPQPVLEQVSEFVEGHRDQCQGVADLVLAPSIASTNYAGAEARVDIEVCTRASANVEPVSTALLMLRTTEDDGEHVHRLRLSRPMVDRLVGQLDEAIRASQKKTMRK